MPKTPDETKKGLVSCISVGKCWTECPYFAGEALPFTCIRALSADALALIQELEAERDAAVDALTKIAQNHDESFCEYCDNWDRYTCPPSCRTYCERFNWRGVQKEDGNA